jgi:hypothetical protein
VTNGFGGRWRTGGRSTWPADPLRLRDEGEDVPAALAAVAAASAEAVPELLVRIHHERRLAVLVERAQADPVAATTGQYDATAPDDRDQVVPAPDPLDLLLGHVHPGSPPLGETCQEENDPGRYLLWPSGTVLEYIPVWFIVVKPRPGA